LAWSEQLLEPQQRALLAALSVFSAPWTVTDAEGVAPAQVADVLEDVAALVENSLVTPATSAPGEPRFRMFDTVRAYASERLDALGVRAATEEAFYVHLIDQVPDYVTGIRSSDQARWQAEFRLTWPDLRRAWTLAVDHRDADRASVAAQLSIPLWLAGRHHEVEDLVARSLELEPQTSSDHQGQLVVIAAHSAFYLGHYDRAAELLDRVDSGAVPAPVDPDGLGAMRLLRGYLATGDGDLEKAERLLAESVELLRQGANDGARWLESFSHNGLGSLKLLRGEPTEAGAEFELSRQLAERSGNIGSHMQALVFMAGLALGGGSRDEARRLLHDSVPLVNQQPYYEGNAYCLEVAAMYGVTGGRAADAARALGLAKALRTLIGAIVWPLLAAFSDGIHAMVREALGDEAFEAAFAEGLATDPRTAGSLVLTLLAD
jgi:hypothetical protein